MSKPTYPKAHWSKRHSYVSRAKLRERIGSYSVEPFADAVAYLLQCRPDPKSIYEWAQKNPDKWANAISIFAKLQGFAEYKVIDHNHTFDVSKMSDSEIQQRLEKLRALTTGTNGTNISISGPILIESKSIDLALAQDKEKPPEEAQASTEGSLDQ